MGRAQPLASGVNSVEGPLGEGDDLGHEQQPIRLGGVSGPAVRRRRRVRGDTPSSGARRASDT